MIKFLKQYIKNPFKVGAIAPSTIYLAEEIIKNIDFHNAKCIVEYGAGTGVFTKEIIKKSSQNTKILVFESNKQFYIDLKKEYKNYSNVIIINDGAENILKYLEKNNIQEVDYIISGLPFSSMPKDITDKIIKNTNIALSNKGEFRTFQYSLVKKKLFEKNFNKITHTKIYKNLPPAYVLKCCKN